MVEKDTEKLMIIFITTSLSTRKCKLTLKKLSSVQMGREKKENTIRLWCAGLVLHTNTSSAKQLQQNRWRMVGYCHLILVKNIKSSSQIAAALKTNERLLLVLFPLLGQGRNRGSLGTTWTTSSSLFSSQTGLRLEVFCSLNFPQTGKIPIRWTEEKEEEEKPKWLGRKEFQFAALWAPGK